MLCVACFNTHELIMFVHINMNVNKTLFEGKLEDLVGPCVLVTVVKTGVGIQYYTPLSAAEREKTFDRVTYVK